MVWLSWYVYLFNTDKNDIFSKKKKNSFQMFYFAKYFFKNVLFDKSNPHLYVVTSTVSITL